MAHQRPGTFYKHIIYIYILANQRLGTFTVESYIYSRKSLLIFREYFSVDILTPLYVSTGDKRRIRKHRESLCVERVLFR